MYSSSCNSVPCNTARYSSNECVNVLGPRPRAVVIEAPGRVVT
eukprot:COSAG02_NODE_44104_length_369_cov_0.555556_2_plen_42_part_01